MLGKNNENLINRGMHFTYTNKSDEERNVEIMILLCINMTFNTSKIVIIVVDEQESFGYTQSPNQVNSHY